MDCSCVCNLSSLLFSKQIFQALMLCIENPSIEAMICMTIERLEHALLPVSHGAQGAFKWIQ